MKRIVLVLLLAILLPAVLLAGLALRSLRDQELVVESQRTRLLQSGCDGLADRINRFLDDLRVFHEQLVEEIVSEEGAKAETDFDALVRERWSQAAAATVVRDGTTILTAQPEPGSAGDRFLAANGDFLTNRRVVEVFQAAPLGALVEADAGATPPETLKESEALSTAMQKKTAAPSKWKVAVPESRAAPAIPAPAAPAPAPAATTASASPVAEFSAAAAAAPSTMAATAADGAAPGAALQLRNVAPMQQRVANEEGRVADPTVSSGVALNVSSFTPANVYNNQVTSGGDEGAVSRLVDGNLHILLWKRHPRNPSLTFWTELDLNAVKADLSGILADSPDAASPEACFALLDSDGAPAARTRPDFTADWSLPFVASEVGPLLPRWEVAAYLIDPGSLNADARRVRMTLWIVILALVGAVATGSVLVARSVGDEMKLAARKTDFVGNVSHELKTPLTSIRMFSELLAGPGADDPRKTRHYAEILSRESARLSRLINRLLDFSKLDRGEMRLERSPVDLAVLVRETVGDLRESVEAAGMELVLDLPEGGGPVVAGDRDALAQVVVNLLGNAVKYAAAGRDVEVAVGTGGGGAVLSVSDRGPGVPRAHRRRIFERFYRVDDSINSGIDGSGIGLALCRQIAERHGGSIRHEPRKGGGSIFVLTLPLAS
jgi:signal transduction histidine kinase